MRFNLVKCELDTRALSKLPPHIPILFISHYHAMLHKSSKKHIKSNYLTAKIFSYIFHRTNKSYSHVPHIHLSPLLQSLSVIPSGTPGKHLLHTLSVKQQIPIQQSCTRRPGRISTRPERHVRCRGRAMRLGGLLGR